MELISEIITVGIIATLGMTAFSYLVSYFSNSKFEEPQLLNILIRRYQGPATTICREHVLGWTIHFLIGMLFVGVFKILQGYSIVTLTLLSGSIFGFLGGIFGVGFWGFILKIHPNPPQINKVVYFIQLVIAHVIFGICLIYLLNF
ncbi:hypothetical protein [Cochleicola gelatinilyticus]|uniref:DUF2938 domain-containing protein n=1 Tax=Cochleicola gelatinilyticus TaxID=1763537 RepID=A0A167HIE6_9FLAO|nr:hypothetical protein [Cochleicola gelatinilyticus]OAB78642.1 hypothetical protein ULVI_08640 [Cochleicola gelatinilyticus]